MLSREAIKKSINTLLNKMGEAFNLVGQQQQIEHLLLQLDQLAVQKQRAEKKLTARLSLPKDIDNQLKALDAKIQAAREKLLRNEFLVKHLEPTYQYFYNFQVEFNSSQHSLSQKKLKATEEQLNKIRKYFLYLSDINNTSNLVITADAVKQAVEGLLIQAHLENFDQPLLGNVDDDEWAIPGVTSKVVLPVEMKIATVTASKVEKPLEQPRKASITIDDLAADFLLNLESDSADEEFEIVQAFTAVEELFVGNKTESVSVTTYPILEALDKIQQSLQNAISVINSQLAEVTTSQNLLATDIQRLEKVIAERKSDLLYDISTDPHLPLFDTDKESLDLFKQDEALLTQRIEEINLQLQLIDQLKTLIKPCLDLSSFDHKKWFNRIECLTFEVQDLVDFDDLTFGVKASSNIFQMLGFMQHLLDGNVKASINTSVLDTPAGHVYQSIPRAKIQHAQEKVKTRMAELQQEEKLTALEQELFQAINDVSFRFDHIIESMLILPAKLKEELSRELPDTQDVTFWVRIFSWADKWNLAITKFNFMQKPHFEVEKFSEAKAEPNLSLHKDHPEFFSRNKFAILGLCIGFAIAAALTVMTFGIATLSLMLTCLGYSVTGGIATGLLCSLADGSSKAESSPVPPVVKTPALNQIVIQENQYDSVDKPTPKDVRLSQSRYSLNYYQEEKIQRESVINHSYSRKLR